MAVEGVAGAPTQQKVHDVIKNYRPARVSISGIQACSRMSINI